MENITVLLIPALLSVLLIRILALPVKFSAKAVMHSVCGLLCLGLLNSISGFTGILFPVNAVTVLIAGVLGLPGMALMALMETIPAASVQHCIVILALL